MQRRKFIKSTSLISAAAVSNTALFAYDESLHQKQDHKRWLNAYYLRAHMYTMVPGQVREDMKWMAGHGTQSVSVAVLEQDLFAAVENIEIICNEAEKEGMKVFIVPSRWGGMVAGAPKVPSLFSAHNPQTWILDQEGNPLKSNVSGVISSIYYQETLDFFKETILKVCNLWDISGVIWDEIKSYSRMDYSPKAIEKYGGPPVWEQYINDVTEFFGNVNQVVKEKFPETKTIAFLYAQSPDQVINSAAAMKNLDYFGLDGRPWYASDGGTNEGKNKTILDHYPRFKKVCKNNNKGLFVLIENHNMEKKDYGLMKKRSAEIKDLDIDMLTYYYYPRNIEEPDLNMKMLMDGLHG